MPRKLNEMPKIASENRNENPKTFPSVEKPSNKPTKQDKRSAESALRSHMEDEDLVTTNAIREVRATLRSEDIAAASKDDKILEYAAAKNKQDAIVRKAEAAGLTSAQFYQMLENGPLDDQPERFGNVKNFFRRLAGQAWAGKDTAQLNKLMAEYQAAETIVNEPAQKDLENIQAAPRSRPSLGGSRIVTREGGEKALSAEPATQNEKPTVIESAEINPGSTANALLEKYNVSVDKGRTIAKDGKLTYEDQGTEELSVADLVKSQTLLSEAYNQIYTKNKKDAKAFAEAVGTIRYENNNSALATEDVATGRAVAAGRKQADVGSGALKTAGRGAGSSSLDRGLSDILQNLDTKLAKAELATVGAEAPIAAPKETPLKGGLSAAQMREFDEANARMNGGRMVKPGTVDRISATDAAALDSTIEQINKNEQMQLTREVEYLAGFSEGDARRAFKLMAPNTPAARLKEITSNTVADTYRAMVNEAAALKNSKSMASQSKLTALNDMLDAVRSFAATISVQEAKLAEMPSIREAYMKKAAAEDRAEFLDDKDIELLDEEPIPLVKRKAPPKVSAAAKAVGRKKN